MPLQPIRFVGESIEVIFDQPSVLEKTPECPNGFVWRGETHRVTEVLSAWRDYGRRGRMARNMQPAHAARAKERGSWGVGKFVFRVRTEAGRLFEFYYDRAPKDAGHRKGAWFLVSELGETK